jgi:hypothetical protein
MEVGWPREALGDQLRADDPVALREQASVGLMVERDLRDESDDAGEYETEQHGHDKHAYDRRS